MDGGTRAFLGTLTALVVAGLTASCASVPAATLPDGTPIVRWATPPDRADLDALAHGCSQASGGAFRIERSVLPADAGARRVEVIRRLEVRDPSLDLLSVDTWLTPELAAAGYLAPVPGESADAVREEAHPDAVASVQRGDTVYATPFVLEPRLLWFRRTAVERAALDTTGSLSWNQIIDAAARSNSRFEVDDPDGLALVEWVRALTASAGVIAFDAGGTVRLAGSGGQAAAAVLRTYADAAVGEGTTARAARHFAGSFGGFAIAGPDFLADETVRSIAADVGWAPYPALDDGGAAAPLSGQNLAVTRHSRLGEAARLAARCLTSTETLTSLMVDSGHLPAYPGLLEDEEIQESYPLAEAISASLTDATAPAPVTVWDPFARAVLRSWSPLERIGSDTPSRSEALATRMVAGAAP